MKKPHTEQRVPHRSSTQIVRKGALEAQLAARPDASDSTASTKAQRRRRTVLEDLLAEISVMRTLRHRNIVTLREVVDDPESNKLLLVMDYMEGGPVMTREALDKGHRIPEAVARHFFRDMLKALDYLHHNKIVHGRPLWIPNFHIFCEFHGISMSFVLSRCLLFPCLSGFSLREQPLPVPTSTVISMPDWPQQVTSSRKTCS